MPRTVSRKPSPQHRSTPLLPQELRGARALVLIAHPDDESFLVAGTLDRIVRSHGSVTVVCATSGERGKSHLDRPITSRALALTRRAELRAVGKTLGVRTVIWSYPDGALQDHRAGFERRSIAFANKAKPTVLFSFGPDGYTAHRDHIAAANVAKRIAKLRRIPLYQFAHSPRVLAKPMDWMVRQRKLGRYKDKIRFGIATHRIAINGRIKYRAIAHHRSQYSSVHPLDALPAYRKREAFAAEYFVVIPAK